MPLLMRWKRVSTSYVCNLYQQIDYDWFCSFVRPCSNMDWTWTRHIWIGHCVWSRFDSCSLKLESVCVWCLPKYGGELDQTELRQHYSILQLVLQGLMVAGLQVFSHSIYPVCTLSLHTQATSEYLPVCVFTQRNSWQIGKPAQLVPLVHQDN